MTTNNRLEFTGVLGSAAEGQQTEPIRTYWTAVFSPLTWRETGATDFSVVGFPDSRFATARKIKPGDRFVCYLRGHSAFVGVLEVVGAAHIAAEPRVWSRGAFDVRVPTRPLEVRTVDNPLFVHEILDRLSFGVAAYGHSAPSWGAYFQSPPRRLSEGNGRVIFEALQARRFSGA